MRRPDKFDEFVRSSYTASRTISSLYHSWFRLPGVARAPYVTKAQSYMVTKNNCYRKSAMRMG